MGGMHCMQMDEDVKAIVGMLVRCAYGRPADTSNPIPSRAACVEVALRECAYNPLSPPSGSHPRDETIYVAFQQHIRFQVLGFFKLCMCLSLKLLGVSAARPLPGTGAFSAGHAGLACGF